jgi:hypothetical protein
MSWDNIKMDLRERGWGGIDWIRIGTSGGLLDVGGRIILKWVLER